MYIYDGEIKISIIKILIKMKSIIFLIAVIFLAQVISMEVQTESGSSNHLWRYGRFKGSGVTRQLCFSRINCIIICRRSKRCRMSGRIAIWKK